MKKIICIAVCCLLFCAAACAKPVPASEQPENTAELVNPMKEFATAEEMNKAIDVYLLPPKGAEETVFSTIADYLADIRFVLDGKNYCLRAAAGNDQDISGVYETFEQDAIGLCVDGTAYSACFDMKFIVDGGALVTWEMENVSYSLYAPDETERGDDCAAIKTAMAVMETMFAEA